MSYRHVRGKYPEVLSMSYRHSIQGVNWSYWFLQQVAVVLMAVIDNQPHQKQSQILVSVFPCYSNSHAITK